MTAISKQDFVGTIAGQPPKPSDGDGAPAGADPYQARNIPGSDPSSDVIARGPLSQDEALSRIDWRNGSPTPTEQPQQTPPPAGTQQTPTIRQSPEYQQAMAALNRAGMPPAAIEALATDPQQLIAYGSRMIADQQRLAQAQQPATSQEAPAGETGGDLTDPPLDLSPLADEFAKSLSDTIGEDEADAMKASYLKGLQAIADHFDKKYQSVVSQANAKPAQDDQAAQDAAAIAAGRAHLKQSRPDIDDATFQNAIVPRAEFIASEIGKGTYPLLDLKFGQRNLSAADLFEAAVNELMPQSEDQRRIAAARSAASPSQNQMTTPTNGNPLPPRAMSSDEQRQAVLNDLNGNYNADSLRAKYLRG